MHFVVPLLVTLVFVESGAATLSSKPIESVPTTIPISEAPLHTKQPLDLQTLLICYKCACDEKGKTFKLENY
jgi:hypothetical protein